MIKFSNSDLRKSSFGIYSKWWDIFNCCQDKSLVCIKNLLCNSYHKAFTSFCSPTHSCTSDIKSLFAGSRSTQLAHSQLAMVCLLPVAILNLLSLFHGSWKAPEVNASIHYRTILNISPLNPSWIEWFSPIGKKETWTSQSWSNNEWKTRAAATLSCGTVV